VVVVTHGTAPVKDLIVNTNAIREKWMEYFSITTGRRASMTATPK